MNRGEFFNPILLIAAVLAVAASVYAAPGIAGLMGGGLALVMIAVAVVDIRLLLIPDELGALAAALGLVDLSLEHWREMPAPAIEAALRAATAAAIFLAFRILYRRLRGREGMGLGDVKLAGVAGVWLDWPSLPVAVELAAVGALGFVAVRALRTRSAPDPLVKLPFGAFFAPAIWICWWLERWTGWTS